MHARMRCLERDRVKRGKDCVCVCVCVCTDSSARRYISEIRRDISLDELPWVENKGESHTEPSLASPGRVRIYVPVPVFAC